MTRNEARRFEYLDPLPGLDAPLVPLNMTTADGEQGEQELSPEEQKTFARTLAAELGWTLTPELEQKIRGVLARPRHLAASKVLVDGPNAPRPRFYVSARDLIDALRPELAAAAKNGATGITRRPT